MTEDQGLLTVMTRRPRRRRPRAGWRRQPVLVVFQQQAPSIGIARDQIQHCLPGIVHQRLVAERPRQQVERFPRFPQAALGQTALVHGKAAHQMTV